MESLFVPYNLQRYKAASLIVVTSEDLSKASLPQCGYNFISVCYVVMSYCSIIATLVIVAMIQVS